MSKPAANAEKLMNRWVLLPDWAVINVVGTDAGDFLQSQFCNDVKTLDELEWQLNGYCTPKGRLLSVFRLYKAGTDSYRMVLPSSVAQAVAKRLGMYVLRAAVTVSHASAASVAGLLTSQADDAGEALPAEAGALLQHISGDTEAVRETLALGEVDMAGTTMRRYLRVVAGGAETPIEADDAEVLVDADSVSAFAEQWRAADISAGVPSIVAATQERFVPQMVNLDALDGLSFKKGCYPGQEIVARMQYLGKQKRHMYRYAATTSDVPPTPGESLEDQSGKAVAEVVDAVLDGQGTMMVLAVVRHAGDEGTDPPSLSWQATRLEPQSLPYQQAV